MKLPGSEASQYSSANFIRILVGYTWSTQKTLPTRICSAGGCMMFAICCLRFLCCICLHWLFAFFVFAAVSEFSVAFGLHVFGLRHKAKCEKKVQPNPEDDQTAKSKQAWKRRPAKMQEKCKPANRGLPKRKHLQNATSCKRLQKKKQKNAKQMRMLPGHCQFSRLLMISATTASFGRPLFAGLHFSCILAGRRFQACLLFAVWSSSGFGCTFFSHFALCLSPKTCKTNATLNSDTAANTKNANSQCKKMHTRTQKKNKRQLKIKINSVCGPKILIMLTDASETVHGV